MNSLDIQNILIVGAGSMGQQIGLQCAIHGLNAKLYDINQEALDNAQEGLKGYAQSIISSGWQTKEEMDAALKRISSTTNAAEAAEDADLLSESVPEDPLLKRRIFSQFSRLCPPKTLFTTNTSSLLPSMIAEATGRPERFATFHFHQIVWISNVVDILPHPGTAPETLETLAGFAKRIGQIPIVANKENVGNVFNTMLNALTKEALQLAAKGIVDIKDIDRAWMGIMKMPVGPLGILDQVGLDTAWKITDTWYQITQDIQLKENADLLKQYVDAGKLGVKTGEGFYKYPNPAFADTDFVEKG